MIQPEDIHRKACNLYPAFLRAWLAGGAFFPRNIPCDRELGDSLAAAIESIHRLQSGAKEKLGFGYSIEWEERRSRTHGKNRFPRRIYFESESDFLRLINKHREFAAFSKAVDRVRTRYPALSRWICSNRQLLIDAESDVDGLLEVVDYFCLHPRPGLYGRELPLSVDTKFIERNRRILREWLDLVLPPGTIRADEDHFDRRFGLKYAEPHILVRFLDRSIQTAVGWPWPECSVPLHTLAKTDINVTNVLIVENKVNLLTLPSITGTIALGGLGNSVTDLRYLGWLSRHRLWYWGDIDADGFAILSRLRVVFPHVQSLLMDDQCVATWRHRIGAPWTGHSGDPPSNLTKEERSAFCVCVKENLRIEQERFPQTFVVELITKTLAASGRVGSHDSDKTSPTTDNDPTIAAR